MGYTIVPRRMACGSCGDKKVIISPVLESRPASLTHTQGDLCSTMYVQIISLCRLEDFQYNSSIGGGCSKLG